MDATDLVSIEQIKQLKARYFRLMDTKQWETWREIFTEHATLRYGPDETDVVQGRSAIVELVSGVLAHAVTVHQGHMPEIQIDGPADASGIWAMFDDTDSLFNYTNRQPQPNDSGDTRRFRKQGYGHYEERYKKEADGEWRIDYTRLTRLRMDYFPVDES